MGTSPFDAAREELRRRIADASGDPAAAKLIASMLRSYVRLRVRVAHTDHTRAYQLLLPV